MFKGMLVAIKKLQTGQVLLSRDDLFELKVVGLFLIVIRNTFIKNCIPFEK